MAESRMKIDQQMFYTLDYGQVNDLICEHFGGEFEYHADQETGNHADTFHFGGKLTTWCEDDVLKYIQTGKYGYIFDALMNRLVLDGVIPAGHYVIYGRW
jgi:hypothetical protein